MKKARMFLIITLCLCVLFSALPALAETTVARTVSEFAKAVDKHAQAGEESFIIRADADLIDYLLEDSGYGGSRLGEIMSNCGIHSYSYYYDQFSVTVKEAEYHAGCKIYAAYLRGDTSSLSKREKQTLTEAQAIVSRAAGGELEKEKSIHDAICARVSYYTDSDPFNDNDCAIGALLNGQADCDGYADAFALCLNLAGIPARIVSGDSCDPRAPGDGGHAWNLVYAGGGWVFTDVTWDDSDSSAVTYLYYNLGAGRAAESYVWNAETMLAEPVQTAGNAYRAEGQEEYSVSGWEELESLLLYAGEGRWERVAFTFSGMDMDEGGRKKLSQLIYASGITDYQWAFSPSAVEITCITREENYRICSAEEEVIAYVNECLAEKAGSFTVYFTKELAERLFANDHEKLQELLHQTDLGNSIRYSYSEESRYVKLKGD